MNKWSRLKFIVVTISIIVLGIVLDQVLKSVIENAYKAGKLGASGNGLYLFGEVGLHYVENPGGAFSILGDFEYKNVVFFILTLIGLPIFCLLLIMARNKHPIGIVGYCGIISGTIGNAIDRLFRGEEFFSGKVRDFFTVGNWFATFNIADMLLVGGAIFVVIALFVLDDDCILLSKSARQAASNSHLIQEDNDGSDDTQKDAPAQSNKENKD